MFFRRKKNDQTPEQIREAFIEKQTAFTVQLETRLESWHKELQSAVEAKKIPPLKSFHKHFKYVEKEYHSVIADKPAAEPLILPKIEDYRDKFIFEYLHIVYIEPFSSKLNLIPKAITDLKKIVKIDLDNLFESKKENENGNTHPETVAQNIEEILNHSFKSIDNIFDQLFAEQKEIDIELRNAAVTYQFLSSSYYDLLNEKLNKLDSSDINKIKEEFKKFALQELATAKTLEYKKILDDNVLDAVDKIKKIKRLKNEGWEDHVHKTFVKENIELSKQRVAEKIDELQLEVDELQKIYPDFPTDSIENLFKSFVPGWQRIPPKIKPSEAKIHVENSAEAEGLVTLDLESLTSEDISVHEDSTPDEEAELKALLSRAHPENNDIWIFPDTVPLSFNKKPETIWDKLLLEDDPAVYQVEDVKPKKIKKFRPRHIKKIEPKERSYEDKSEVAMLLKKMEDFSKKIDAATGSLKEEIQENKTVPDFAAFLKDKTFEELELEHQGIVKEREALQDDPPVDPAVDFPVPGRALPEALNHFPDFASFKQKFIQPFFAGYAAWFAEPIKNFKDISLYKENVEKIFQEYKSWGEIRSVLDKNRIKIHKAIEDGFSIHQEYETFQKDLAAAEPKYAFHLTESQKPELFGPSDLLRVQMEFDCVVADQITQYKAGEFKLRLDYYLNEFNNEFNELKTIDYSIDDLLEIEKNRLTKITNLNTIFHERMEREYKKIIVEIAELEKDYPGLKIPKPEIPDNPFSKIQQEWDVVLENRWKNAVTKDFLSLSEVKLTDEVQKEIQAVQYMPLLEEQKNFDDLSLKSKENLQNRENEIRRLKIKYFPDQDEYINEILMPKL
ncbi:MAG TPA: hypothetical protein VHM20_00365, partial [Gammaproteobacteria bacterium]|nr:hypothetical protein [Gammaproteobacteria bacterium]